MIIDKILTIWVIISIIWIIIAMDKKELLILLAAITICLETIVLFMMS